MKYYQPQFFKPTLFKSGILIFFEFIFISLHMKILLKKQKSMFMFSIKSLWNVNIKESFNF